jgi:hypothetical protein
VLLTRLESPKPKPEKLDQAIDGAIAALERGPPPADDGVPAFLKRAPKQERKAADPEVFDAAKRLASGEITKEDQKTVAAAKAEAKRSVKDAELRGLRRRMPLTGKAAITALSKAE